MKQKKSKWKYNLLVGLTLGLPISIVTLIYSLYFYIEPDFIIYTNEPSNVVVVEYEEDYFAYVEDVNYYGLVTYHDELHLYGIVIDSNSVVKIGNSFYQYMDNTFIDVKDIKQTQETGGKGMLWFILTSVSVGIVLLVINKHMKFTFAKPRLKVMVALWIGTGVLYLIDLIVGNLLVVFLTFAVSWTVYYIEYLYAQGKLNDKEKATKDSLLLEALKEIAK